MYKVLNSFREISHKDHVYKAGDTYPANGFDADPKRVEFLQSTHREYKVKFLSDEIKPVEPAKKEVKAPSKPKPAPTKKTGADAE